jgi:hypothetical protein
MIDSKFKGLVLCSMMGLLAAGQAVAHTGVRDQATAAVASYNGFTITHGCADYIAGGQQYPVIGQAALFPYGATAVWRELGVGTANGTVIADPTTIVGVNVYNLGVKDYASASSAFPTTNSIVDGLGNIHALFWKDGAMEPKQNTVTPFKITHPAIIDKCIASVKVRVAVINFCDVQKNQANDATGPYTAPKDFLGRAIPNTSVAGGIQANVTATSPKFVTLPAGNGDHNRADWWFSDISGGSQNFADSAILSEGLGLWSAGITVNNPSAYISTDAGYAGCPGGKPRQVTVEPSGVDFDTYLTAGNLQPFVKLGSPNNF